MKWLAYGLLIFGAIYLASAVDFERRGVAMVYTPSRYASLPKVVKREDDPEYFRKAMTYVWYQAGGTFLLGALILAMLRRQDETDPFSEHFGGKETIDELERTLDEEEQRRKKSQ
jgi:hypothetical protein